MSKHFTMGDLLRYTGPSIGMMIFVSIYEVVDGLFVSNFVSSTGLAAVNMAYPVFMILGTIGYMFGTGGGAIVGRVRGEGDEERANRLFSLFIYASIFAGIAFTVIGIPLLPTLFTLMGASGELLDLSVTYGTILMFGLVLDVLQYIFSSLTMTAGKPELGLYSTLAAGITNIALDALFVGVLGWGVAGAAWASVAGLAFGGLIPLVYFARPNSSYFQLCACKVDLKALGLAAANGSSEMVGNIAMSVSAVVYNVQLLSFIGEDGVAAYGVIGYVALVFAAIFVGYSTGASPLMSYQYGSENRDEMRYLYRSGLKVMAVAGVAMFVATRLAAGPIAAIFVSYDADLQALTEHAFSIYSLAFVFMGFNVFASSLFTSVSNGMVSALLSFLRTMVFEVGLVLLLPAVFGPDSIWYSVTIAEVVSLIFSGIFMIWLGPVYGFMRHRLGRAVRQ